MSLRINGYAIQEIRTNGAILTDIPQRLKSCIINMSENIVYYTVEGDENTYSIRFTVDNDNDTITYEWSDGFICTISIIE